MMTKIAFCLVAGLLLCPSFLLFATTAAAISIMIHHARTKKKYLLVIGFLGLLAGDFGSLISKGSTQTSKLGSKSVSKYATLALSRVIVV